MSKKQEWKTGATIRVGFLSYHCVRELRSGAWLLSRERKGQAPAFYVSTPYNGIRLVDEQEAIREVAARVEEDRLNASQQLELNLSSGRHAEMVNLLSTFK